jgi:tetratricopeptide (TPR) repeat protein
MLFRPCSWIAVVALASAFAFAQKPSTDNEGPGPNQDPPRSSAAAHEAGDSSSRDSIIDLSPPRNDAKDHPDSSSAVDDYDQNQEFQVWDPHKADKDIEVGDFYFKRWNYAGAESRYREALHYQSNNAVATFRLAQTLEKQGKNDQALQYYAAYLKILPHGPDADESNKAIVRLKSKLTKEEAERQTPAKSNSPPQK